MLICMFTFTTSSAVAPFNFFTYGMIDIRTGCYSSFQQLQNVCAFYVIKVVCYRFMYIYAHL